MNLTRQDLDVLIEATEAWERKDDFGEAMGDILTSMVVRNESERDKLMAEREVKRRKMEDAKRVRKERSIVLRAKLIGIRDSVDADRLLEEAAR